MTRELSAILLSNAQLREHYTANREQFRVLAGHFVRRDSLRVLGRVDRNVNQLNRVGIEWGAAAQHTPKEAIDEYLASATPEQRSSFETQLRAVDAMRKMGRDSLARYARKYRLNVARIDSAVAIMRDLRITFVNAILPWKGTVQFTVAGAHTDAIGYFFAPNGGVPNVAPEEYYYLEEIGDGWWIFRAT